MISIIYKFTNVISGKYYIGSLKDITRFHKYKTSSKEVSRMYSESPFHWVKEIIDSFENVEFSKVVEIEQRAIQLIVEKEGWGNILNECYFHGSSKVFSPEAVSKRVEKLRSEEVRQRISNSLKRYYETHPNPMKGKIHDAETRKKLSVSHEGIPSAMKGKSHSDKTKQILREVNLGKKASDETKTKMSKSLKGRDGFWKDKKRSDETKAKMSKSAHLAWEKRKCV